MALLTHARRAAGRVQQMFVCESTCLAGPQGEISVSFSKKHLPSWARDESPGFESRLNSLLPHWYPSCDPDRHTPTPARGTGDARRGSGTPADAPIPQRPSPSPCRRAQRPSPRRPDALPATRVYSAGRRAFAPRAPTSWSAAAARPWPSGSGGREPPPPSSSWGQTCCCFPLCRPRPRGARGRSRRRPGPSLRGGIGPGSPGARGGHRVGGRRGARVGWRGGSARPGTPPSGPVGAG